MVRNSTASNSTSAFASPGIIPGTAAALVANAIFAYGQYFLGNGTIEAANRSMMIGSSAIIGGVLAKSAIFGLVATYGTASTGTAIASLSGAAATKATLAVLGGGTLASGGMGATGGLVLLGGVGVIVVVVLVPVITFAFTYKDEQEQLKVMGAKVQLAKEALSQSRY